MIAADVGPPPGDFPVRVEHDAVGLCVAPGKPRFPREGLVGAGRISFALCELLAGHAPDEPSVTGQFLVQPLEQAARSSTVGAPTAGQRSTI